MNAKGHLISGAILVTLLFICLYCFDIAVPPMTYLLAIPVTFIYSQLPDIDHHSSKIRRLFVTAGLSGIIIATLFGITNLIIILASVLLFVHLMHHIQGFGHRGVTHTYLAALIMSLPLLMINGLLFGVGLSGYVSHLLADLKWDDHRRK